MEELVKLSSGIINKIVKDMLPQVSAAVDTEITAFNKVIASEAPYTFDVPLLGKNFPLNLTMSAAPAFSGNLIQINFDGTFHDP